MNYIFCGYKSSGKTHLGKELSQVLNYNFIDIDKLILCTKNSNTSIAELYRKLGKQSFRELEVATVLRLQQQPNTVIATGGGTVLDPRSANHLKKLGQVIYLRASCDLIYQRFLAQGCFPSFLDSNDLRLSLETDWHKRDKIYQQVADRVIAVDGFSSKQLIAQIME